MHDCWPMTGHCAYFDYIGCKRWKSECHSCPLKTSYPASYVFDRSKYHHKLKAELFSSVKNLTIVPVSNWLGDLVRQSHLKNHAIIPIHNGIDTKIFCPNKPDSSLFEMFNINPYKKILIGVASIWGKRKGFDDFLKIRNALSDDIQIIMVGLDDYHRRLLPDNIIGIKRTNDVNQLADLYSIADAFINPTWEDNYPTTNLEAISCGTPVITYNTGGSPEAIVPNQTGLVVNKYDVASFVSSINDILTWDRKKIRQECRCYAENYFDKSITYSKYISLYDKLVLQ